MATIIIMEQLPRHSNAIVLPWNMQSPPRHWLPGGNCHQDWHQPQRDQYWLHIQPTEDQGKPAQFWHNHTEWGAQGDHTQCLCQRSQKGQHSFQHQLGYFQKSCTLQPHHQNLQALHHWKISHPLPPRGCNSKPKIWIFLQMLAQGKASPGKKLEAFLKNFYFTFTFHKICKIKLNMDILLHFLFYFLFFIFVILCTNIYATLFNSFSNKQIFKAKSIKSQN